MNSPDLRKEKKIAAIEALKYIKDGYVVGLGTGSTAEIFIEELGRKVREGLKIYGIPTSVKTAQLAQRQGIKLLNEYSRKIDVDVDGTDEIDTFGNMIKGGGGALLREKIVASNSKKVVIISDHSKSKDYLGEFPLPVEINRFMADSTLKKIREFCKDSQFRQNGSFITDSNNLIIDCKFGRIEDPKMTLEALKMIPGVMEVGLFIDLCSISISGHEDHVEISEFKN